MNIEAIIRSLLPVVLVLCCVVPSGYKRNAGRFSHLVSVSLPMCVIRDSLVGPHPVVFVCFADFGCDVDNAFKPY